MGYKNTNEDIGAIALAIFPAYRSTESVRKEDLQIYHDVEATKKEIKKCRSKKYNALFYSWLGKTGVVTAAVGIGLGLVLPENGSSIDIGYMIAHGLINASVARTAGKEVMKHNKERETLDEKIGELESTPEYQILIAHEYVPCLPGNKG
ncbi:hypothetical protein HQ545_05120 [Candidatus Woesearchaeota archaeon]|nr:hypothetical protein [Candidatus Woesearchaeota archaeon]